MLICQRTGDMQPDSSSQADSDWTAAAQSYSNVEEAPTFVTRHRQQATPRVFTTSADPDNLQGTQLEVYTTVSDHFTNGNPTPLRLIITGTEGTGKSDLIHCLSLLLGDTLKVAAPTGVASFIIDGTTLHSLFHLPTRGEFKDLEGNRLMQLQQVMSTINTSLSMRCQWLVERYLVRLTDVYGKPFPTALKKCLVGARFCCLETLASYHQSWIYPSTPLTPAHISLIKGEQHISSLTGLSLLLGSCIKLVKILIKFVVGTFYCV